MSHAHNQLFEAHHLWGVGLRLFTSSRCSLGVVLLLVNNDYQQLGSGLFSGGPYVRLGCNRCKFSVWRFWHPCVVARVMDGHKAVHWWYSSRAVWGVYLPLCCKLKDWKTVSAKQESDMQPMTWKNSSCSILSSRKSCESKTSGLNEANAPQRQVGTGRRTAQYFKGRFQLQPKVAER